MAQQNANYKYEPSEKNPYGLTHPDMPKEFQDFAPLIGKCNCKSVSRIPNSNNWNDTVLMSWTFKYIMNGKAIQDETLKEDGTHSGSIRQFNTDSAKWYVHYYSSSVASSTLGTWEGNKTSDGNIILYRKQKSPNGLEGFYKITFSNISENGFDWLGEWVNTAETFSYPTWKIFCTKSN